MTIEIHPTAKVSSLADIEDSVRGTRIVIGPNSFIDSFVKIKPAGGSGDFIIGSNVTINSGCVFYTGNGIHIGNSVLIAANCVFAPTNHEFESRDTLIRHQGFKASRGGIIVEDDVWLGANTVLLDGTKIGVGAVVGAHSLVRGELQPFSISSGTPLELKGFRS
jgi:virginiamycin A acetyltransferase